MRTALIHVVSAAGGGYEARLAMDWDGKSVPGPGAPLVSFDAPPAPPQDGQDWVSFLLETEGSSAELDSLGGQLHDLLLTGDIGRELEQVNGPLRVLIRVDPEDLAKLPWELMRKNGLLTFTDASRPVARIAEHFDDHLELPEMCWPLRVMLVVASKDEQINVKDEIGYVKDAFRKVCGLVDLEVCWLPSRERIRKLLESMKPHVFHFIGHGGLDEEIGGYLRLEQESGPDIQWTANSIRDDLAFTLGDGPDPRDPPSGVPRLVVLNACQSGQPGEHDGTLAAVQGLTSLHVPAVIAMQGPIRGDVAASFALGLYETLSAGGSLDRAVTRARVRITDILPGSHRDYAVPQLILGARPEHILDLSQCDPRRSTHPLDQVLTFVDRLPRRRQLWDGLWSGQRAGPRIFTITGPDKSGKGSMVKWCLGVAALLGYPTVFADTKSSDLDSFEFLKLLVTKAAESIPGFIGASESLRDDLRDYESERGLVADGKRAYERSPLGLYRKLASTLDQMTADRPLLIGIDGLSWVEPGTWMAHAVPGLVLPIAESQAGNVRLVVSLQENERDSRFPARYFDGSHMVDVPIKLFPAADFVELMSQRLRAKGLARDSFNAAVETHGQQWIKQDWNTVHFEFFDGLADQFEMEPES